MRVVPKELSADLLDAPDVRPLTPEEEYEVKERQKGLDALLETQDLAKYKLEVMFSTRRSSTNLAAGTVTWWESGNKLHGGGDSKLYLCDSSSPDPRLQGKGCKKFIPDSSNGLSFIVCPHCQTMWRPENLVGEIFYNLPSEKWAQVLLQWFHRLDMRTDIRIKYGRMSIRDAQTKENERGMRGELLEKARSFDQRSVVTYPLKNIIKDTAAGADLGARILAFLRA